MSYTISISTFHWNALYGKGISEEDHNSPVVSLTVCGLLVFNADLPKNRSAAALPPLCFSKRKFEASRLQAWVMTSRLCDLSTGTRLRGHLFGYSWAATCSFNHMYQAGLLLGQEVLLTIFWEFHSCTAAVLLPRQAMEILVIFFYKTSFPSNSPS